MAKNKGVTKTVHLPDFHGGEITVYQYRNLLSHKEGKDYSNHTVWKNGKKVNGWENIKEGDTVTLIP